MRRRKFLALPFVAAIAGVVKRCFGGGAPERIKLDFGSGNTSVSVQKIAHDVVVKGGKTLVVREGDKYDSIICLGTVVLNGGTIRQLTVTGTKWRIDNVRGTMESSGVKSFHCDRTSLHPKRGSPLATLLDITKPS